MRNGRVLTAERGVGATIVGGGRGVWESAGWVAVNHMVDTDLTGCSWASGIDTASA